jgi:orotate phosphoribosyltransferase
MNPELLNLLSARRGHFKFESGHHGDLWLNLDVLFLYPQKLEQFINALAEQLQKYNTTAVCGPLVGGALIAHMVAAKLGVEFYFTEPVKISQPNTMYSVKYRLPKSFEYRLHGKRIVIVDDVINAGSAVRATFAELSLHGAHPVAIGSLLVLGTSAQNFFAEQGIPIESIETIPNNLWMPNACPLCASNIPLDPINND